MSKQQLLVFIRLIPNLGTISSKTFYRVVQNCSAVLQQGKQMLIMSRRTGISPGSSKRFLTESAIASMRMFVRWKLLGLPRRILEHTLIILVRNSILRSFCSSIRTVSQLGSNIQKMCPVLILEMVLLQYTKIKLSDIWSASRQSYRF